MRWRYHILSTARSYPSQNSTIYPMFFFVSVDIRTVILTDIFYIFPICHCDVSYHIPLYISVFFRHSGRLYPTIYRIVLYHGDVSYPIYIITIPVKDHDNVRVNDINHISMSVSQYPRGIHRYPYNHRDHIYDINVVSYHIPLIIYQSHH